MTKKRMTEADKIHAMRLGMIDVLNRIVDMCDDCEPAEFSVFMERLSYLAHQFYFSRQQASPSVKRIKNDRKNGSKNRRLSRRKNLRRV